MTVDLDAFVAAKRFGLGPRPGEIDANRADPRGRVLAQLERPDAVRLGNEDLPGGVEAIRDFVTHRQEVAAFRKSTPLKGSERMAREKELFGVNPVRSLYHTEVFARVNHAAETDHPFLERLVAFWSNHLCIGIDASAVVRLLAGQYERDVIRPHILGRFEDMLSASVHHPAMLEYLDNSKSVGPNSVHGQRSGKTLNENLARELMELHTLGVDGGYGQHDVIEVAKVLSGWTYKGLKRPDAGRFSFNSNWHEPGSATVLGQVYDQPGEAQGAALLRDLARHPATARHLSTKMVRYFLGYVPDGDLIDRLAGVYTASDGNLGALTKALVEAPEMWDPELKVLISPYEFLIATMRATDIRPPQQQVRRLMKIFGQLAWSPPSPAGWPDDADAWLSPDALLERVDWAEQMVRLADAPQDMDGYAETILGPAYDPETRQTLLRAESRGQAFVMLLMSPGFQRR